MNLKEFKKIHKKKNRQILCTVLVFYATISDSVTLDCAYEGKMGSTHAEG